MEKGQPFKWTVQAFDSDGAAVTGIAANITAEIRSDNTTSGTATTDTNPDEISDGYYDFSITSSESSVTNCMTLFPATTAAAHVIATPKMLDFGPANFTGLVISTAGVSDTNAVQIDGDAQSLADLKDFADEGYDPSTNKVQGVVLTDTCTTNTDMRGTDSALLAANVPSNFDQLVISTVGNANTDVKINSDKTGYSISGTKNTLDDLNDLTEAQVESNCFDALDLPTTSGGAPTAGSMLDYTRRSKFALCNKWVIEESSGDLEIYDDSGTLFATIPGAFTSAVGDTTRLKIL